MQIVNVSVLDGKGLISIVVADDKDRIRIQDYFRKSSELIIEADEFEAARQRHLAIERGA